MVIIVAMMMSIMMVMGDDNDVIWFEVRLEQHSVQGTRNLARMVMMMDADDDNDVHDDGDDVDDDDCFSFVFP